MKITLTQEDKNNIWKVVDQAVKQHGSLSQLFSNRIEFVQDSGSIRFQWPTWMLPIKNYLSEQYGEANTEAKLISLLREVMSESNYQNYLHQAKNSYPEIELKRTACSQPN